MSEEFEKIRKYQQAIPVDVIGLARELELPVYEDDEMSDDVSGILMKDAFLGGASSYCIIVNKYHPENRRRFTIAHEIAHFILHRSEVGDGIEDNKLYRSRLSNRIEAQANRLAADILMPWDQIEHHLTKQITEAAQLAKIFGVSESAMSIRLGIPVD